MRVALVVLVLSSLARAQPAITIDGWVTPTPQTALPEGLVAGAPTWLLPPGHVVFQAIAAPQGCPAVLREAHVDATPVADWTGYPRDVTDRAAVTWRAPMRETVVACTIAGGRPIELVFVALDGATLDHADAQRAIDAVRAAYAPLGMKVTLPASGLALELASRDFTVSRAAAPELGGDADVLTHGALVVEIAVRPTGCAEVRALAKQVGHWDAGPVLAAYPEADRETLIGEGRRRLICFGRGTRSVAVEWIGDGELALSAIARALPPRDGEPPHEAPRAHDSLGVLLVGRLYIGGMQVRASSASAAGGRLGGEAFVTAAERTQFAIGVGASAGIDANGHASFDAHLKGGLGHALGAHAGVFGVLDAGIARTGPTGDATTGGYLGGEADLRFNVFDIAGGATTRGQHARIAVVKVGREPGAFGVSAGAEWIHDGAVQLFSLYLAFAN